MFKLIIFLISFSSYSQMISFSPGNEIKAVDFNQNFSELITELNNKNYPELPSFDSFVKGESIDFTKLNDNLLLVNDINSSSSFTSYISEGTVSSTDMNNTFQSALDVILNSFFEQWLNPINAAPEEHKIGIWGYDINGDNIVLIYQFVDEPTSDWHIAWSIDKGKSWSKHLTTYGHYIDGTMGSFVNTSENQYSKSPAVFIDGEDICIAFPQNNHSVYKTSIIKGVINGSGDLILNPVQQNMQFDALNYNRVGMKLLKNNGKLYLFTKIAGGIDQMIGVSISEDNGNSWSTEHRVKNLASSAYFFGYSWNDYSPWVPFVVDHPTNIGENMVGVIGNSKYAVASDNRIRVWSTSNQDLSAGWNEYATKGPALDDGLNIIAGHTYLDDHTIALHIVKGHKSGNVAGTTLREASGGSSTYANTSHIKILDVQQYPAPELKSGNVHWGQKVALDNGYSVENTNGYYFNKNNNNIISTDGTSLYITMTLRSHYNSVSYDKSEGSYIAYIPDLDNINQTFTTKEVDGTREFKTINPQLAIDKDQLFVITKHREESINSMTQGTIIANEVTLDSDIKPELILNGSLDLNRDDWLGTCSWSSSYSGIIVASAGNHCYQDIPTEIGQEYRLSWQQIYSISWVEILNAGSLSDSISVIYGYDIGDGISETGNRSINFVAEDTLTRILIASGSSTQAASYKKISVKKVDLLMSSDIEIIGKSDMGGGYAGRSDIKQVGNDFFIMSEMDISVNSQPAKTQVITGDHFSTD